MAKKICSSTKQDRIDKQKNAKFKCKSCGMTAKQEKHLCKPSKI